MGRESKERRTNGSQSGMERPAWGDGKVETLQPFLFPSFRFACVADALNLLAATQATSGRLSSPSTKTSNVVPVFLDLPTTAYK